MSDDERAVALSAQLVEVHQWLREELARLRASISSSVETSAEDRAQAAGLAGAHSSLALDPGRDLVTHCLTFCSVLSRHHGDEDVGVFPVLDDSRPELSEVLAELRRDHEQVAGVVHDLQTLLADPAPGPAVLGQLDGLAALLESHFGYEERKLSRVVDQLAGRGIELTRVLPPLSLPSEPSVRPG